METRETTQAKPQRRNNKGKNIKPVSEAIEAPLERETTSEINGGVPKTKPKLTPLVLPRAVPTPEEEVPLPSDSDEFDNNSEFDSDPVDNFYVNQQMVTNEGLNIMQQLLHEVRNLSLEFRTISLEVRTLSHEIKSQQTHGGQNGQTKSKGQGKRHNAKYDNRHE